MKIINFLRARFRKWLNEEYWLEDYVKVGMKIGTGCDINPGLIVDHSHCWLIEIGNNVTIAPHVYLLAHDASIHRTLGHSRIGKVILKDGSFIGARALIMPGVTVGENAIVAAGSIVTKSVEKGKVVGGNPAKVICTVEDLLTKHKAAMETAPRYDEKWLIQNGITAEMKQKMSRDLDDQMGYLV